MDEEETNSWYEEEKQKLMEQYVKEIQASKVHDDAEKRYEAKLSKLIEKYNKMMEQFLVRPKNQKEQGGLKKYISLIRQKIPMPIRK